MRTFHLGGSAGISLLSSLLLTGCSLFLASNDLDPEAGVVEELASSSPWLIAAQGQGVPPTCARVLPPGQARKIVEKALREKSEVQALVRLLQGKGKRLSTLKARGCRVKKNTGGQGLAAMQTSGDEATLLEVPAGSDAALYLLENSQDGNYWASLKETADVGERLVHLEVGLAGDAEIQGSSGDLGELSFLLPDETGLQDISEQMRQLLTSSGTVMDAGLQAMQADSLDWAKAEVVVDEASTTLSADGEPEFEALVVVPAEELGGQDLWNRVSPPFDESPAVYAKVTLRKTVPSGSTKPRLQVTAPPSQAKKGSELTFEPFDLCPYQHYGRVTAFRKSLCYQWEQKVAPKVQQVTFHRGIKSLPAVHKQTTTATQNGGGRVIGIAGPKGNVIIAGMKNVDATKLQQIYDKTVQGQSSEIEGQDVASTVLKEILKRAGVPAFILNLIFDAVDYWQSLGAARRSEIKNILLNLKIQVDHPDQFMTEIQNRYNDTPAFRELVDKMVAQLRTHLTGFSDVELRRQAFDIFFRYMNSLAQSGNLTLVDRALDMLGVSVVIAFGLLDELNIAPSVTGQMLLALQDLAMRLVMRNEHFGNIEVLVAFLAVSAAQAAYGTNVAVGTEGIARVQLFLLELVPQMQAHGWIFFRIVPEEHVGFAFQASLKTEPAGPETYIHGLLEPYLQNQEVDAMVKAIQNAVQKLQAMHDHGAICVRNSFNCRYAIVEIINAAEAGAVNTLCGRIQNEINTMIPIVVIGPDGQVACSKNMSQQEAQELCRALGFCSQGPGPAQADPMTIQAPVPSSPEDPACPRWRLCLI
jgi:hypothetical protein